MQSSRPRIFGLELDPQTRCAHYHSPLDIIAIKMKCCDRYYACKDCHDAMADHPIQVWPVSERDQTAVMCGACNAQLTIEQYLACSNICPACQAHFNPGCRNHYHFYFQIAEVAANHLSQR
jgi:uncharacterized CHY-type Zn-finger protein